jgi:hypothetical protein
VLVALLTRPLQARTSVQGNSSSPAILRKRFYAADNHYDYFWQSAVLASKTVLDRRYTATTTTVTSSRQIPS